MKEWILPLMILIVGIGVAIRFIDSTTKSTIPLNTTPTFSPVVLSQSPIPEPTIVAQPIIDPDPIVAQPIIDPDPMVNCRISQECGGGSKLIKSSECSKTICCWRTEGSGKWVFYLNRDQCLIDQAADKKELEQEQADFNRFMSGLNQQSNNPQPASESVVSTPVPINWGMTDAEISACKKAIDAKYTSLISSACASMSGSAASQCEINYRNQADIEKITNCR